MKIIHDQFIITTGSRRANARAVSKCLDLNFNPLLAQSWTNVYTIFIPTCGSGIGCDDLYRHHERLNELREWILEQDEGDSLSFVWIQHTTEDIPPGKTAANFMHADGSMGPGGIL